MPLTFQLSFSDIYAYCLVFARVAVMLTVMPVFSDMHIPQRVRVLVALSLTVVLTEVLSLHIPTVSADNTSFYMMLVLEGCVGFFLGSIIKIWLMTLQVTANIMSFETSLSNATVFNPSLSSSDSIISAILMVAAVTALILGDFHHIFIRMMVESYQNFPVGQPLIGDDVSRSILSAMSRSFYLAIQLALPFLVLGLIYNLALGFLNRLMPQLQVFFLAMPAQLMGGIGLMLLTISLVLHYFLLSYDSFVALPK